MKKKTAFRLYVVALNILGRQLPEPKPTPTKESLPLPTRRLKDLLALLNDFFLERSGADAIEQINELMNVFLSNDEALNKYCLLNLQNMVFAHGSIVAFFARLAEIHAKLPTDDGQQTA